VVQDNNKNNKNNKMAFGKPTFTLKTYGSQLNKRSPQSNDKKLSIQSQKPFYCNATPYSQGQDWVTTYSYDIIVTANGEQQRIAYVACDYVE
jgi:hypothetical protein